MRRFTHAGCSHSISFPRHVVRSSYVGIRIYKSHPVAYNGIMKRFRPWFLVSASFGGLFAAMPGSAQVDTQPPSFTILGANPAVVDVTNGEATTEVEIRVTDDLSGLRSGSILVLLEDTALKWFFDRNKLVSGVPTNGLYRVPITFTIGSPPGNRPLGAIVFDGANRSSSGYPDGKFITVVNNGLIDREPPTIHSLTITPQVLDLTNGPGSVTVEMDVSDDATGIQLIFGDVLAPIENYTPDTRKLVWNQPTVGNERKVITTTYPLGAFSPAGEWRVEFEQILDNVLRFSKYSFASPELYEDFDATFTVINPNEDISPPVLESVVFPNPDADSSFGSALIPFSVRFSDSVSGIDSVSVSLHPPSGGSSIYAFRKHTQGFAQGDAFNGTIETMFEIPSYIETGDWSVSVRLRDIAGNSRTYGFNSENPLPAGSTAKVSVSNSAGNDQSEMEVTGFSFSPDPVDISNGGQFVEFLVSFTDNLSGFQRGSFRIKSPDEVFSRSVFLNRDDIVSGTFTDGTVKGSLFIPPFSQPGEWKISSFSLSDAAGNLLWLTSYPVFKNGFPNGIHVTNTGPLDVEAPVLKSLSLPQLTVDITDGNAQIPIEVTASDDVSGVDSVFVRYTHAGTGDSISFFLRESDLKSRSGTTSVFEDTGLVRQYSPPGTYTLTSIDVEDLLGRETEYGQRGDFPLPSDVPQSILVINSGPVDLEKPQFHSISASSTAFDVTDAPANVIFEIAFTDDQTGVEDFEIRMRHEGGQLSYTLFDSWLDGDLYEIISGNPLNGTARLICELPRFAPPGRYTLSFNLRDSHRRSTSLSSTSDSYPFPELKTVEIINNGPVDRLHPILTDIKLPTQVDTTDLAQTVPASISFLDDISGLASATVFLSGPDGDLISKKLDASDIVRGTPTDGTLGFEMEIPAFSAPGIWEIRVAFEDGLQRFDYPETAELAASGLQSTLTVENRQPPGYLWKGSAAYADGWRYVEWFGWVQDLGTYPYAFHPEHGWIYTLGTGIEQFAFYDFGTAIWWWVSEATYPYLYASGQRNGWYFYYAPYGSPGNRWFNDLSTGADIPEAEM